MGRRHTELKYRIQFGCDCDGLAAKVLSGEKTATSSLYEYYRMGLKELMNAGEYVSVADSTGNEVCVVEIVKSEIVRFEDITEVFAVAEGDGSLENWLEIHTGYYSSLLEKTGKKLSGETELLCEWFRLVGEESEVRPV